MGSKRGYLCGSENVRRVWWVEVLIQVQGCIGQHVDIASTHVGHGTRHVLKVNNPTRFAIEIPELRNLVEAVGRGEDAVVIQKLVIRRFVNTIWPKMLISRCQQ